MGIDFNNNNAHWSYIGFNEFRARLAEEIGIGDLRSMVGFGGTRSWRNIKDPLKPLMNHSDCDGILTRRQCNQVYPRLLEIVCRWDKNDYDRLEAEELIKGMKEVAEEGGRLIFT